MQTSLSVSLSNGTVANAFNVVSQCYGNSNIRTECKIDIAVHSCLCLSCLFVCLFVCCRKWSETRETITSWLRTSWWRNVENFIFLRMYHCCMNLTVRSYAVLSMMYLFSLGNTRLDGEGEGNVVEFSGSLEYRLSIPDLSWGCETKSGIKQPVFRCSSSSHTEWWEQALERE